ncbi:NEDD4-binding protein 2-like 2 [Hyla sarda]|uniref:NEDD4-binding protein 2-like 2 n=1 Tax=Hyla sarda TaxID=327740 RepID=UPI0024C3AE95|nr:NEDD4-binding protein 2-like 2 [Hyla sarda]
MWRPLRGLSLVACLEMPHAEKNFPNHVHDLSFEPCLKKSRPDYSSWAKSYTDVYKEHYSESKNWSFSSGSEERYNPSHRWESGTSRGYKDVRHDTESYLEPQRHHLGQDDANKRDCSKTDKCPFVPSGREKREYDPDVTFSGTSSSFIGPLCRPPPKEDSVPKVTKDPNAPPSFTIATVELGKSASQSKGQNGMDYELRQFYKELDELEAEADDTTKPVTHTDVDIKQRISPYPDKTPVPPTANHHHGQVPASQPFGPLPNAATNLVSLTCHVKEEPRPSLPLHNQFSCPGPPPTNFLFGDHSMPPPRFEGPPPPTFIVPYGPPPPRFNYPMTFPRPSNAPPPPQSPSFTCNARNEHPPWPGPPLPPESRSTFQGVPYNKPFLQGTGERTWKDPQQSDFCRQEDERILPHMDNVSHEQYRFKEKKVLVLLRGVPGSGKSTLARTLLRQAPDGIVLSTDDYFCQENGYTYDVKLLGDAHSWNQNRARRALNDGCSPVIIDNTNIQSWEMKPYVQMAIDRSYYIEFLEPDTWWKKDAHELEKRNTHRVPREKISQMLERYEHDMTVPVVMNSMEPRLSRPSRPPPEARQRWGASVDCSHNSSSFHSR